jgi:hypothetical protein
VYGFRRFLPTHLFFCWSDFQETGLPVDTVMSNWFGCRFDTLIYQVTIGAMQLYTIESSLLRVPGGDAELFDDHTGILDLSWLK